MLLPVSSPGPVSENQISAVVASLHWPLQRLFKMLFVFKALDGLAPSYFADLLKLYPPTPKVPEVHWPAVPNTWLKHRLLCLLRRLWSKLPLHVSLPVFNLFKSTFTAWLSTQFKGCLFWLLWSYCFLSADEYLFTYSALIWWYISKCATL